MSTLAQRRPDFVINCAAWTDVDGCESDPKRAFSANADGPENLATSCRAIDAGLVTVSTDYVFDGKKEGFYTQRDDPNPQSVYAKSKLDGERRAQNACARTTVVRTGFVFGPGGKNFLSVILEMARKGELLKAITDSTGTPTYALDLAERMREVALRDLPGIYHVVSAGEGTTYETFVRATLEEANIQADVETVLTDSLKRPAPRPKNSRLRCLLSPEIGLSPMRSWRDALSHFVAQQSRAEVSASL
jgi:dTDP-4-dehydrorhamnose reductase